MASSIDTAMKFHADALNLRAFRQQLLASNIANADTPGYQARDVDFEKSLKEAVAGRSQTVTLARTSSAHMAPQSSGAASGAVLYRTVIQPSVDGNTVDMDVERSRFTDNAIHYEANLQFINSHLKAMLAAIQG